MKKLEGRPYPFGASHIGSCLNFSVCVPEGECCELLLYRPGESVPEEIVEMPERGIGEVRFLALENPDGREFEYNFRIGGKVCLDPYVKEIVGHRSFGTAWDMQEHNVRGRFGNRDYDWEQDQRPEIPDHEVIAYSLHVRGFTMDAASGVRHKGTFRGLTEKLSYLKELGINQIQCMPVYEFEEDKGRYRNYWGYGQGYYFAPKAAYAASEDVQGELKDMVKACHRNGIEVVLEMPFAQGILPQTALECLRSYMLDYHVDGFVINPYLLPWESLKNDPILKGGKLLRKEDRFQNTMRRFLKGDEGMVPDVMWALKYRSSEEGCCNTMTSHTGFTLWDLVSYDGKHNEANGEKNQDGPEYNYSWNCGIEGPSRKRSVVSLRKNQIHNALLLLFLAQGTPCLLAGDEFGNTQNGNNNVYCQDNETGWVSWKRRKGREDLLEYVKELIALRKSVSVFHQEKELLGMDRTACGIPDISYHGENAWQVPDSVASRQLGVMYAEESGSARWYVAYNMHWEPHMFALPALGKGKQWYLAGDTARILKAPQLLENQKCIEVKERKIVLLIGR